MSDGKTLEGFGQHSEMIQHKGIPLVAAVVAQARGSGDMVYRSSRGGKGVQGMWSEGRVSRVC